MLTRFRTLAACAALPLVLAGCEATDPIDETALLGLELEPVVGTEAYSPGQVYTVNGRAMTFSAMRVYVSNIRLVDENGDEHLIEAETPVTLPAYDENDQTVSHSVRDAIVYAALDEGTFEGALGEVPLGHYHAVRFDVGLDGMTNHVNAAEAPDGHPLALQDLGNHWDWNMGYIFVRTEGRVDVDGNGSVTDPADADWNIHLGTDGYVIPVEVEGEFEIEAGGTSDLHLQLDLAHFLEGVDLGDPDQRVCHTMNNIPVADAVSEHAPDAFLLHGLHHEH